MSRPAKEPLQITVKEASYRLKLTERTVLNFIKLRRVDAVKVGKEWFIDYPSFIAFAQRYKFQDFTEATDALSANPLEITPDETPIKTETASLTNTAPKINSSPKEPSSVAAKNYSQAASFKTDQKSKDVRPGLSSLRVYLHCSLLFESENFKKEPTNDYEKRVRELSFLTLEDLGAGYHSFGVSVKLKHYSQARSHLGAILALLLQNNERKLFWHGEKEEIESHILPAFTALLRKIERRPPTRAPQVYHASGEA